MKNQEGTNIRPFPLANEDENIDWVEDGEKEENFDWEKIEQRDEERGFYKGAGGREEVDKVYSFSKVQTEYDDVDDEWLGIFGFMDKNGKVVIEAQYLSVGRFSHGLCPVCLDRTWYRTPEGERYCETHWGYIDTLGKMVIPLKFRRAWSFNKYGVAVVQDEYTSDYYLIDTKGKMIANSKFCFLSHYYRYTDRYLQFSKGSDSSEKLKPVRNAVGLYDTKARKIFFPPVAEGFLEYGEDKIKVIYFCSEEKEYDVFREVIVNEKGEERSAQMRKIRRIALR